MDTALTQLAQFSDWTLAILPRLFLYPGGLCALLALLWTRFVWGGPKAVRPHVLAVELLRSQYLALATAWVGLALLPLPGTTTLPFPADRLSLAGLLLTSLLVGVTQPRQTGMAEAGRAIDYLSVNVAMLLAVMAPIAGWRSLLPGDEGRGLPDWVSLAAILLGLCVLSTQAADFESNLRWLAWLGLGASPLWVPGTQTLISGVAWVSLVYLVSITALVGVGRLRVMGRLRDWLAAMCWALAALSLLLALLG